MNEAERFDGAVELLPARLRDRTRALTAAERGQAEELRLRVGRPMSLVLPSGERELPGEAVTERDLELLVELATGASVHTASAMLRAGFISCRGGYRVGLGGSVWMSGEAVGGFSAWSSAAIRVSREHRGAADGVLPGLYDGDRLRSALILAPPGGGKTTLLREAVRCVSTGCRGRPGLRVSVCDERGELAAMCGGRPQLDVGPRTDVLDGCPKARAAMMALRALTPQVLAMDEITESADVQAVLRARGCGVAILATAHASAVADLRARPVYRELLEERVFERFAVITRGPGGRVCRLLGGGDGPC